MLSRTLFIADPYTQSASIQIKTFRKARQNRRRTLAATMRLHLVFSSCPTMYLSAIAYEIEPTPMTQKILGRMPVGLAYLYMLLPGS